MFWIQLIAPSVQCWSFFRIVFLLRKRLLRPFRLTQVSSWDLSIVLEGLSGHPLEPLESVSKKLLTLRTVLLVALSSIKRVGDLQALSISPSCMDFAPRLINVLLQPRPDCVHKVTSNLFCSQQVGLKALPHTDAGLGSMGLCPVRALRIYVDHTAQWRGSDQLFVCFGGKSKGKCCIGYLRLSLWPTRRVA